MISQSKENWSPTSFKNTETNLQIHKFILNIWNGFFTHLNPMTVERPQYQLLFRSLSSPIAIWHMQHAFSKD